MDETKGTPGDESKGKGTPGDESKGTPKGKGKLYTEAQITKIKSDSAAMASGREKKAADQAKTALTQELQSTKSRLDALEREQDESRLAEARGDPDQLRVYNREQALVKRERVAADKEGDLTKRETQLASDLEALEGDKHVVNIAYIAAKHGLETEDLESLGISDPEALEKVAEKLAAAKPEGEGEDADRQAYQALETDAEREAFIEGHPDFEPEGEEFDSGEGAGGGAKALTTESVEKMPMATLEKAIEKAEPKS